MSHGSSRLLLTILLTIVLSEGQTRTIAAQVPNLQSNWPKSLSSQAIQATDRELANLLNQPFESPLVIRKIQLQKLHQHYETLNHAEGLALTDLELAWIAYQDADYLEAERKLRPIEFKLNPSASTSAYWRLQSLKGLLKLEADRPQEALNHLFLAQAHFHSWTHQQIKQVGLARTYQRLGQYRKAAGYAQSAARLGSSPLGKLEALQIVGDTAFEVGQFDEAIGYYQDALRTSEQIGTRLGRRTQVITIQVLTQLGRAYQAIGQGKAAQRAIDKSVQQSEKIANYQQSIVLVLALNAAAMVSLDGGNQKLALEHLQHAQNLLNRYSSSSSHFTGSIATLINFGHYYQKIGDFPQAIPYYEKARELADRIGDRASEARANSALGELLLQQNKLKAAIQALSQSVDLFESLRPELRDAQRITIAETQAKTYELLQTAFIQDNNPNQALITVERARARALVDLLEQRQHHQKNNSRFANSISLERIKETAKEENATIVTYAVIHKSTNLLSINNNQKKQIEKIHTWVINPNGKIFFRSVNFNRLMSDLVIKKLDDDKNIGLNNHSTRREFKKFTNRQRYYKNNTNQKAENQKPVNSTLIPPVTPVTPILNPTLNSTSNSRLNLKLNNTANSREILNQRHQSDPIIRTDRGTTQATQQNNPNLNHHNFPSNDPEYDAQHSNSHNIYQFLIEPIVDLLPNNDRDRVILIPQGPLFLIPFQALEDAQGNYLIQKHTLQIAPSIQTLNYLSPTKKSKANPLNPLIVGNPAPMPKGYEALPGSETEAQAIVKLFNIRPLLGSDATKENVLQKMPQASLIHLATHGTLDDRSGLENAIILANPELNSKADPKANSKADPLADLNSSLTAGEILDLRLKADLVVLSACNTGRGYINGEGVIGLSRSFLSAGVSSLVVSLWQVPDQPTSALMIAFHENRKKGEGKAQALRQAMLTTMEQYPDPQDWAGFMLIGRSD